MDTKARITAYNLIRLVLPESLRLTRGSCYCMEFDLRNRGKLLDWDVYDRGPKTRRKRVKNWQKSDYLLRAMYWLARWVLRATASQRPRFPTAWVKRQMGWNKRGELWPLLQTGKPHWIRVYWRNCSTERQIRHEMIKFVNMDKKLLMWHAEDFRKMRDRLLYEMAGGILSDNFIRATVPEDEKPKFAFMADINHLLYVMCSELGGEIKEVPKYEAADPMTEAGASSGTWWTWEQLPEPGVSKEPKFWTFKEWREAIEDESFKFQEEVSR